MISKCLIVPYFGEYPPWMNDWFNNTERMKTLGYNFLFDTDEAAFRDRVRDILMIEPPPMMDTGRIWTFRPALGLLYAREIQDYEFWGHTDFDCVYGRVEEWVTDEFLDGLDVHSNHDEYMCGPWSLYRNTTVVNNMFKATGEWRERMEGDDWAHGWAEKGFSRIVDDFHDEGLIRRQYTKWQTRSQDDFSTCVLHDDGRLTEDGKECMMLHFRRVKQYPKGCVL